MTLARASLRRVGDFNAQSLANTAWAFATADQTDAPLFAVLSRATERCVCDFDAQTLTNTAWAFAIVIQADSRLFVALARVVQRRIVHFNEQDLVNTAWAFATVGEPTPVLFDPILVLDTMEMKDAKPQVTCYQTLLAKAAAECCMSDFNAQALANTAWAFATVGQRDELLFTALASAAKQRQN